MRVRRPSRRIRGGSPDRFRCHPLGRADRLRPTDRRLPATAEDGHSLCQRGCRAVALGSGSHFHRCNISNYVPRRGASWHCAGDAVRTFLRFAAPLMLALLCAQPVSAAPGGLTVTVNGTAEWLANGGALVVHLVDPRAPRRCTRMLPTPTSSEWIKSPGRRRYSTRPNFPAPSATARHIATVCPSSFRCNKRRTRAGNYTPSPRGWRKEPRWYGSWTSRTFLGSTPLQERYPSKDIRNRRRSRCRRSARRQVDPRGVRCCHRRAPLVDLRGRRRGNGEYCDFAVAHFRLRPSFVHVDVLWLHWKAAIRTRDDPTFT